MILGAVKYYENGIGSFVGRWTIVDWEGSDEIVSHQGTSLGAVGCARSLSDDAKVDNDFFERMRLRGYFSNDLN